MKTARVGGMNRGRSSGPPGSTCSVPHSHQVLQPGPSTCLTNGPANGHSTSTGHCALGPTYPPNIQGQDHCTTPPRTQHGHRGRCMVRAVDPGHTPWNHPSPPHADCAALGKSLNLCVPQAALPVPADSRSLLPSGYGGMDRAWQGLATWRGLLVVLIGT